MPPSPSSTNIPAPHPALQKEADAAQLEDGEVEIHYVNGEMQILLRGMDISESVSRVSWYWMDGMAPRISLDFGHLSTMHVLSKISTASFSRPPDGKK